MSTQKLSEENSKPLIQINIDQQNETEFSEVVTSVEVDIDHAGKQFTQGELAIYNLHREACEVRGKI